VYSQDISERTLPKISQYLFGILEKIAARQTCGRIAQHCPSISGDARESTSPSIDPPVKVIEFYEENPFGWLAGFSFEIY
jgi:hypothetical protein